MIPWSRFKSCCSGSLRSWRFLWVGSPESRARGPKRVAKPRAKWGKGGSSQRSCSLPAKDPCSWVTLGSRLLKEWNAAFKNTGKWKEYEYNKVLRCSLKRSFKHRLLLSYVCLLRHAIVVQSILPNELGEERLHDELKERLRGRRDRLLCMGELEYPGCASARGANFQFSAVFFFFFFFYFKDEGCF